MDPFHNGLAWRVCEIVGGKQNHICVVQGNPELKKGQQSKRTLILKVKGHWCVGWTAIWQRLIGMDVERRFAKTNNRK